MTFFKKRNLTLLFHLKLKMESMKRPFESLEIIRGHCLFLRLKTVFLNNIITIPQINVIVIAERRTSFVFVKMISGY